MQYLCCRNSRNRTIVGLKGCIVKGQEHFDQSRNRTIVGLKLVGGGPEHYEAFKSQSHHSGIETLLAKLTLFSCYPSQSHHSGIETSHPEGCQG